MYSESAADLNNFDSIEDLRNSIQQREKEFYGEDDIIDEIDIDQLNIVFENLEKEIDQVEK